MFNFLSYLITILGLLYAYLYHLKNFIFYFSAYWNKFFNLTMTYRQESDVPYGYGHITRIKDHPTDEVELNAFIEKFGQENLQLRGNKSKSVAWFVSNCFSMSGREDYVNELKKYMQVIFSGFLITF